VLAVKLSDGFTATKQKGKKQKEGQQNHKFYLVDMPEIFCLRAYLQLECA
jgi:hypothetical protein